MPFSGFSHGIKSLKTAISLAGRMRQIHCIAITSALPNEGKTTIAANLATLFALSGMRTLLVDGDIRNASLSRAMAPAAKLGLLEAISGAAEMGSASSASTRSVSTCCRLGRRPGRPFRRHPRLRAERNA